MRECNSVLPIHNFIIQLPGSLFPQSQTMIFLFKKMEVSSYLYVYLLVALFCRKDVSAQENRNKDKGISTSSPKEKLTFGKDDFLEFIKGKLRLSARINVGGTVEGMKIYTILFFVF